MRMRSRARLVLAHASDRALTRRPELTMRVVSASLDRRARREPGEPYEVQAAKAWLAGRVIDLHPGLGRALVRRAIRRAAQRPPERRNGRPPT